MQADFASALTSWISERSGIARRLVLRHPDPLGLLCTRGRDAQGKPVVDRPLVLP